MLLGAKGIATRSNGRYFTYNPLVISSLGLSRPLLCLAIEPCVAARLVQLRPWPFFSSFPFRPFSYLFGFLLRVTRSYKVETIAIR